MKNILFFFLRYDVTFKNIDKKIFYKKAILLFLLMLKKVDMYYFNTYQLQYLIVNIKYDVCKFHKINNVV